MTPLGEMDRLFDQMRSSMWSARPLAEFGGSNVRVETDDDGSLVHADVPGFENGEIDLRFDDGLLTVEASHETEGDGEFRSRRVHEQVRVPDDVLVEPMEASYNNGVLEVSLPSSQTRRPATGSTSLDRPAGALRFSTRHAEIDRPVFATRR